MHQYLIRNPLSRYILLASPLVLALPLFFFKGDILDILYSTIFLGSFHVLLTPLFQSLLERSEEAVSLNRRMNTVSLLIFFLGLFLAVLGGERTSLLSEHGQMLIYSVIIFSVAFHSAQQEFGILLSLQRVSDYKVVKWLYLMIPFGVSINYYLVAMGIKGQEMAFFILLSLISSLVLYKIYPQTNKISFLFCARILLWPISILILHLTPLVFAMHGIEYLIYYLYMRDREAAVQKSAKVPMTLNFVLTVVLILGAFGLGHYFRLSHVDSLWGDYLLAAHFALQFRHYWLDRQIFKLSKPFGQRVYGQRYRIDV